MQDELVSMMSRHMHLTPVQAQDSSMPATPQVSPQAGPITYITQHYHHSGHHVPVDTSASAVLVAAGVNASVLLPSQLSLFKHADDEQKQRLIELWRISPPTPGKQVSDGEMGNWPQTSMEQEEVAARQRWEEMERERLKNLCALPGYDNRAQAEPYIVSLYNQLPNPNVVVAQTEMNHVEKEEEYKHCKDPVYNSREWWHMSDQEPMEHQYGMLQAMMYGNGIEYAQPARVDVDEEML
jgi:hypothetical protein